MLTMRLWNCLSWLMPVKLPVQEESLVWLNYMYTVEDCFTVNSLLINLWRKKISFYFCFAGVIPYLPYSKQAKMNKRGSIPSKLVASLMGKAGIILLILCDSYM